MWIELYNLAQDSGITFEARQLNCIGDLFRVQLVLDGPHYQLPLNDDGDWEVNGVSYTDLGVCDERFDHFTKVNAATLKLEEF